MQTIQIKAGERKRIIFQFSNSLARTHNFSAKSLNGDAEPVGEIEVKGSNWLFPKPGLSSELRAKNGVEKRAWDTFYSVYVTPKTDTEITLNSSPIKNLSLYLIIALVIVAVASALFFAGSGGGAGG